MEIVPILIEGQGQSLVEVSTLGNTHYLGHDGQEIPREVLPSYQVC